jgi:hypothetical protein
VSEDHVGEKGLNSNWLTKLGFAKKPLFASFLSCMLENAKVKFVFPYAMSPCHKGAKKTPLG